MFERFSQSARDVVVGAQAQARNLGHAEIGAEHVLLAVVAQQGELGSRVLVGLGLRPDQLTRDVATLGTADADALRTLGVDLDAVRRQAEASFGPGALDRPRPGRKGLFRRRTGQVGSGHLRFNDSAKRALEQSLHCALAMRHHHIGSEHVLLGLLASDQDPAARVLRRHGLEPADVRARILEELRPAA